MSALNIHLHQAAAHATSAVACAHDLQFAEAHMGSSYKRQCLEAAISNLRMSLAALDAYAAELTASEQLMMERA